MGKRKEMVIDLPTIKCKISVCYIKHHKKIKKAKTTNKKIFECTIQLREQLILG